MTAFTKTIEVRWADLDPNFHMLHSKYYDIGAYCRMAFLVENGLTPEIMKEHFFGPIIFREECIFKKEIAFGDIISVNVKLKKLQGDYSRWTMIHEIWKNEKALAALITCDGAWMDTRLRKLTSPSNEIKKIFENAPKTDDFLIYTKETAKM